MPRNIADPTIDEAFKVLFGRDGGTFNGIDGEGRLLSFLNSILSLPPFNITVNHVEYLPVKDDLPEMKKLNKKTQSKPKKKKKKKKKKKNKKKKRERERERELEESEKKAGMPRHSRLFLPCSFLF